MKPNTEYNESVKELTDNYPSPYDGTPASEDELDALYNAAMDEAIALRAMDAEQAGPSRLTDYEPF